MFPLGLASVKSAATSPLPGFLLSQTGHAGHLIAAGLLVLAGPGGRWCRWSSGRRGTSPPPPGGSSSPSSLMFTLAPSTRFGYYIYPLGLWIWLRVGHPGDRRAPAAPQEAGEGPDSRAQAGHGPAG